MMTDKQKVSIQLILRGESPFITLIFQCVTLSYIHTATEKLSDVVHDLFSLFAVRTMATCHRSLTSVHISSTSCQTLCRINLSMW